MGIFKAYDIRGRTPDEIHPDLARRLGWATVTFLKARTVAVGHDVRESSPTLAAATAAGARDAGAEVWELGLCTTPMSYFACSKYGLDGAIMVTASHNPPMDNGFKICRAGASALSEASGLKDLERLVRDWPGARTALTTVRAQWPRLADDYIAHLRSFLKVSRPLKIAVDTAHGCVGAFFDRVIAGLPLTIERLCFEPDGRFPSHEPNPLKDENVRDLAAAMKARPVDLGVAFDGDGDRAIFFDERGRRIPSDFITALLSKMLLAQSPGAAVVYDLRSSRTVPEEIERAGGKPIEERVGHSFIKETMRRHNAVFGGELSGHFYFRANQFADSGQTAFTHVLTLLAGSAGPMSALLEPLRRYFATGELNFRVEDKAGAISRLAELFADGKQKRLDGLSVEYPSWWFNVRQSNTEPLLRLNLEGRTAGDREAGLKRVTALIGPPLEE